MKPGFDIFCRVVDNYGDIGVCWRLARQLAVADRGPVRLWVDKLESFARLQTGAQPGASIQTLAGITIVHWTPAAPDLSPHGVVIETFACSLPGAYRARLKAADHLWFNLDYLSAEGWVEQYHGLPSLQADGLHKRFLFPGFTPATAGLLRENGLIAERDAWRTNPALRWALLNDIGVPQAWIEGLARGWRQVFLFCYRSAPLGALIEALARQEQQSVVLVPTGVLDSLPERLAPTVHFVEIPFVSQPGFDRLLWSSDLNIVRGEDSFIRAIWAARPFIWHIYEQDEDTHLVKLDAWLDRAALPPDIGRLIRSWNAGHKTRMAQMLDRALKGEEWKQWQHASSLWSESLAGQTDLATRLLALCPLAHEDGPNTLK